MRSLRRSRAPNQPDSESVKSEYRRFQNSRSRPSSRLSGMAAAPDLAGWWRRYEGAYEGRSWRDYRHLLAETIRYGPCPPLLDVGCGLAFLVECARQFGMPAVGLEASEHALAESRRRHPHADVRRWQAGEPLPFEDGAIGMAMLNQIVDHLSLAENHRLFGELHRVLKPDGILVV